MLTAKEQKKQKTNKQTNKKTFKFMSRYIDDIRFTE